MAGFAVIDAGQIAPRNWRNALKRGLIGRCPNCGEGHLFTAYLKVAPGCTACGEDFSHQRADDAPPYVTMFLVGHIVVALFMALESATESMPMWGQMVFWPLLAAGLSLALLPRVKGALIGYQWALRMHGFGEEEPAIRVFERF